MAKLTIAVNGDTLTKARVKAVRQGTSINALLRDNLTRFAGARSAQEQAAKRFIDLAAKSKARRGARRWSRDDLHSL